MVIAGVQFGLMELIAVIAWAIVTSAFIFVSTRLRVNAWVRSSIAALMFLTMILLVFYLRFGLTLFSIVFAFLVTLIVMGGTYPTLRLADRKLQKTKTKNNAPKQQAK